MRNVLKATGHGLKHFFGARESRGDYQGLGRSFRRSDSKVRKAEVLVTMGMYAVYKGSPIGLPKNICVRQGQAGYRQAGAVGRLGGPGGEPERRGRCGVQATGKRAAHRSRQLHRLLTVSSHRPERETLASCAGPGPGQRGGNPHGDEAEAA